MSSSSLKPTFRGYVEGTDDALILFEACVSGQLIPVHRRPSRDEFGTLTKSGNVFIYEIKGSGIRRWGDLLHWTCSRKSGGFFYYLELNEPTSSDMTNRVRKKKVKWQMRGIAKQQRRYPGNLMTPHSHPNGNESSEPPVNEPNQDLVSELNSNTSIKEGGLIKKTITLSCNNIEYRLVSYFTREDVDNGHLLVPSRLKNFQTVFPHSWIVQNQRSRFSVGEITGAEADNKPDLDSFRQGPPPNHGYGFQTWHETYDSMPLFLFPFFPLDTEVQYMPIDMHGVLVEDALLHRGGPLQQSPHPQDGETYHMPPYDDTYGSHISPVGCPAGSSDLSRPPLAILPSVDYRLPGNTIWNFALEKTVESTSLDGVPG
ncbi:hypothetical protein FSARC_591 [Fusarium sarcochroum]|uniref:Uncharacterized protein n=1 Tax=Fusarium sarcochroum TaxID=1208366 RepID=A0A8H4UBG6_9HYPO|nr:hypothetical protein FSARC_591 [Fusarium sarcochroum]